MCNNIFIIFILFKYLVICLTTIIKNRFYNIRGGQQKKEHKLSLICYSIVTKKNT